MFKLVFLNPTVVAYLQPARPTAFAPSTPISTLVAPWTNHQSAVSSHTSNSATAPIPPTRQVVSPGRHVHDNPTSIPDSTRYSSSQLSQSNAPDAPSFVTSSPATYHSSSTPPHFVRPAPGPTDQGHSSSQSHAGTSAGSNRRSGTQQSQEAHPDSEGSYGSASFWVGAAYVTWKYGIPLARRFFG